jgi:hypothetical protein
MSRERLWWTAVSVVVLAAMLSPLLRGRDGFPLSNYPMFAEPRDTVVMIRHVVGVTAQGRSRPLPPAALGTDEIMQASQIATIAARRRARAADLCVRVADELRRSGESYADIVAVEVRSDEYDAIAYWLGERTPQRGELHASCPVEPGGGAR